LYRWILFIQNITKKNPRFTIQFTKLHENGQGFPARCLFCKLKDILRQGDKYEFKENLKLGEFITRKEIIYWNEDLINLVKLKNGINVYPKNIIGIDLDFFGEVFLKSKPNDFCILH
jgi:hypothetical protein